MMNYDGLLDPSKPIDPATFDTVATHLSSQNSHDVAAAQEALSKFKSNPESFFRCDALIVGCTSQYARFLAANILEEGITKRWNTLSEQQQSALRTFLMGLVVSTCRGGWDAMRSQKVVLTKINAALIAIAKREWPHRWPTFVRDVCTSASGVEDPMVENCIRLLTLLGEDIFEFGDKGMTSRAAARKKVALQEDFQMIYSVLVAVLTQSKDTHLTNAALKCFTMYVPWMPFENVFDGQFLDFLSLFCINLEILRYDALRCLTEISALSILSGPSGDSQKQIMVKSFRNAAQSIMNALPHGHSSLSARMRQAAELDPDGADVMCLYFTTFLKRYLRQIIHDDVLLKGVHEMLVGVSTLVERKETFKSCVEYWWWLGETLLRGFERGGLVSTGTDMSGLNATQLSSSTQYSNSNNNNINNNSSSGLGEQPPIARQLQQKLNSILTDVRFGLIKNMARPEEIIIVEEEGEIRRETVKDVENLQLYQLMREALIFFTHLDPSNTQLIMTTLMAKQLDRSEWSWGNCSTLCWAVGSISGAMNSEHEKDLFVAIMSDLLKLCKEMIGKENRAVIASNIMYVVGQYPRFLRNHKSFLRTVSRKLFEFMRELFPGVQDMAVDTFLKLTKACPEVFLDAGQEPKPFVWFIIQDAWDNMTGLLSPSHIELLHSAMGHVIHARCQADASMSLSSALDDGSEGSQLVGALLHKSTVQFKSAAEMAATNFDGLISNVDLLRTLLHILRNFSNTASTCGPIFIQQMQVTFDDLQGFYAAFSSTISSVVATHGPTVLSGHANVRLMRLIKKEILKVIELFTEHTLQDSFVAQQCMPKVFDIVLSDYVNSHPLAREPGTLALVTACVNRLRILLAGDCAAILDHTFAPTVSLIVENTTDFPEHRVNLFRLLHALNEHCFDAFLAYISSHEDIVDSILWAIKHTERNVMSTGLELLLSLLVKVVGSEVGESFYKAYMHRILTEVLVSALDTLHTSGFQTQCSILQHLFQVSGSVAVDMPAVGRASVSEFFRRSLSEIPTLVPEQIVTFVDRCYVLSDSSLSFRQHVADFLIEVQIWGGEQENSLLREEEQRQREQCIPGLSRVGGDISSVSISTSVE
jgi:exportin-1